MHLQAIYAFCKKDLLFLIMRCCFVNKRKVMGRKQRLLIILPEVMSDIQVQIVKGGLSKKLIMDFRESEGPGRDIAVMETEPFHRTDRKFVLVWYGNDYRNVPIDDILWVKANGRVLESLYRRKLYRPFTSISRDRLIRVGNNDLSVCGIIEGNTCYSCLMDKNDCTIKHCTRINDSIMRVTGKLRANNYHNVIIP